MSKSKSGILDKTHWDYVVEKGVSSIHSEPFPSAYKEQAEIAMDEWAKMRSVEFSKWKDDFYMEVDPEPEDEEEERLYVAYGGQSDKLTTDQLYDLFIQHQS